MILIFTNNKKFIKNGFNMLELNEILSTNSNKVNYMFWDDSLMQIVSSFLEKNEMNP